MTDKPYVLGAAIGAAVGSAIGYFYFTEAGRRQRDGLGRTFERLLVDAKELQAFWTRVQLAVDEYKTAVHEALDARQSRPFYSEGRRSVS